MQLWTDYEGVTIDGAFPLQKLLLPEGRSAFFSTAGPKGEPAVLRLIECHFDEEEILARWRCLAALHHPNFLDIQRYGQIEIDGSPVVYAVFENVDANLAEVLDRGNLTVKDVAQLASSLVAALDVLHTHGFIHEHIEPRNIFAVSDVVRLRTDCIREAPEGREGRAAKQRDIRDLATVLLQALTQQQSLEGISDHLLPPPFDQIIRNGLVGTWGLENMRDALERQFGSKSRATPKSINAAAGPPEGFPKPALPAVFDPKAPSSAPKPSMRPEAQLPLPLAGTDQDAKWPRATSYRGARKSAWNDVRSLPLDSRWMGAGMAAVIVLLFAWGVAHAWNAHRHRAVLAAASRTQPAAQSTNRSAAGVALQPFSAASPRVHIIPALSPAANSRADWRVIAFTYTRRADAEKEVSTLAHSHPDLQAAVFSPRGHAPYLVSIGGVMERGAADALARRSRSLGLPRDTYAQNYSH